MKDIKFLLLFILTATLLNSCNQSKKEKSEKIAYQCPMKCEGDKVYTEKGTCPVCGMKLRLVSEASKKVLSDSNSISDESIFNLTSKWNTQEGKTILLKDLKGKTLVMVMIYTSCRASCPILVADVRGIEEKIPKKYKNDINYVFVSIDPKTDTPKRLKKYAAKNNMNGNQWIFLQGTESSVREFANVLSVKYKQISPLAFSHSNVISVFNPKGELVYQQDGLNVNSKETIAKIIETVKK